MAKPTVKAIDKHSLKNVIRPALEKKLEELSKELGINFTTGRATFEGTGQTGTFKLDLAIISETGEVITKERKAYEQYHNLFGLPADGFGKEVVIHGQRLKIAGLRMRAPKNNVLLDTCDGSGVQRIANHTVVSHALQAMEAQSA